MRGIVEGYFQVLKFVVVVCLAVMVVLVFGNVVLRYGFNSGITVSEELSRWFFVWMTFLGAVIAMRDHAHLGVDSLVKVLPALGKKACLVASHLLMLFATLLFLQGSWVQTKINMGTTAPATGLPVAWVYGVGIVFSVSVALILLYDLFRIFTGRIADDELVMVIESEEQKELELLQERQRREQGRP